MEYGIGPSGESRKTVTVLFCDVVAYTELGERLDPESLRHLMSRYFATAAAVLERHGGTVEKFVGDEVMAVFGVPVVHEDDALRAVRAAFELRESVRALETELDAEAPLELRIGINTGEVVAGSPAAGHGFVTGDPVAVGKRLEGAGAPGEILLGEATHALVAHAVKASALGPLMLKGKSTAVRAFRLESVHADATAVRRSDDACFVGRERELERLREHYAGVVAGGGARLVTITGEPGIGKSRLTREALAGLEPEPTLLVGRCPPYGEGVTFWPLREVLHQAGRDESELAGSSQEVFVTVRRLLVDLAGEQALVVVFDDVHWAEPTFLDLVEYLAARLGDARVLLLCLARPQLADQRPAWLQPPAQSLVLEPLSEAESELMLEALDVPRGVRRRLADAAEGNPLFVEQLAAIADEAGEAAAMPDSIRGVLHERLDRLDREERAVLERASVAGRSFSLGAVRELSPAEEKDGVHARLISLVRQRFVRADPLALDEGFRFQHALIRDATYDGIPKVVRADLHGQMAMRLETHGLEDAFVGYHLEQSFLLRRDLGRTDVELGARAGQRLRTAGREAFSRSDLPATLSLYERARELLPDDDATMPSLLTELGYARIKRGDVAGAEADLDEAIAYAQRFGDRGAELRGLVERQFARSVAAEGPTTEESVRVADAAIAELENGDPLALARAWWLKSEGDVFACRWRKRADALEQGLTHARHADAGLDVAGTLSSLLAQALCWGPTPVPDAIVRVDELLASQADRGVRATVSTSYAWLLAMQGLFEDARTTYASAIATFDDLGLPLRRAVHAQYGAQIELLAGDPSAAAAELRVASDDLSRFGARAVAAALEAIIAGILCTLGQWPDAEELARSVAASAPADDLMPQLLWRASLSRVLAERGDIAEAEVLAAEALRLSEGLDSPELRVAVLSGAAEVESKSGRAPRAGALREEAHRLMAAKGNLVAARQLESPATVAKLEQTS